MGWRNERAMDPTGLRGGWMLIGVHCARKRPGEYSLWAEMVFAMKVTGPF